MPKYERFTSPVEIVGWIDDEGNLVDDVPDRFQSRYLIRFTDTGEVVPSRKTLADNGLMSKSLRDVVTFGFAADEYLAIIEFEKTCVGYIQNEDQLEEFMDYVYGAPSP